MLSHPIVLKTLGSEQKYPYFLKNQNIDDNTYIVQRAYNIPNALYILDVWNSEKYNIGEIDRYTDANIPYTKYLYSSNDKIVGIDVNGGDDNFKVLIYKKDGKMYTSALLKFSPESS